jgi:hypothetical protein
VTNDVQNYYLPETLIPSLKVYHPIQNMLWTRFKEKLCCHIIF